MEENNSIKKGEDESKVNRQRSTTERDGKTDRDRDREIDSSRCT